MPLLIYQVIVLLLLLGIAGNFLLNLLVWRRPEGWRHLVAPQPLVSVLVPARDEEERLPACLDSLLRQDYPCMEILVLDDHSTDGTCGVVEERIRTYGDSRLRLLKGRDLPEGWTGKAWACQQLAEQASGQYLLFTDADTRHRSDSVGDALAYLMRYKADMLSLWPRQLTGSWSELLVIPFVHILILWFLPHWMSMGLGMRTRSLGAACGQFILLRRGAYEKLGGHKIVRSHLVEDVALARECLERGMKLLNADGSAHVSCRMYSSLPAMWEGFTKNLRAGYEKNLAAFVMTGAVLFGGLCFPFFFLAWHLLMPSAPSPNGAMAWSAALVAVQVLLVISMRMDLAWRVGQPWLSIPLHPLGVLFCMVIAANSWLQTSRGSVTWKGRRIPTQGP